MKLPSLFAAPRRAFALVMPLLVACALIAIIPPGDIAASRSVYLDARPAQQCQSNVALNASTGDGSTLPVQVTVNIRRTGQEGWYNGYTTFTPPAQTKTCFFPGQGDWDLQFGASRFFTPPPVLNVVHCDASFVCKGGASATLYLTDGDISGTVTEVPSGRPLPARVEAATPQCGPGAHLLRDDYADSAGHYDLHDNSPSLPDNVGAPVFGGGAGPGTATYQVYVLGSDCAEASDPVNVSSNEMVVVNLTKKAPYMEEPSLRDPPTQEPCDPPCGPSTVGEPISVATGNMFLDQTDITISTLGSALAFVRSYNSQLAYRNIAGGFGPGWSNSYDQRLTFPATGIIMLRQAEGVPAYFQDVDVNLTYDASVPFNKESWIEKQANGTYIRRLRKGGYESYDSAGRLTSMVDAFGNTTTLGRDGTGRLTSISAPGSRSLTLTYNTSNRIATLSGPAGLIATYTYDASSRLQKVTYTDGRGYTFTYDGNRQLLTVSDLSGKVLETHTYSGNKAITSEISAGREKYTLSYSPLKTTVTDALGNVTTYDWTNIWGKKYVTKISGPCSSCSGGNQTQSWTYDSKGRVLSYSHGNGKKTTYVYDANGDLISETDAAGSITSYTNGPDGRPTSAIVKSVVDPAQNKVTSYEYDRSNLKIQTEQGLLGDSSVYSYTTTYAYDANGKLTSIDGPRTDLADVTTFGYNSQTGDLNSITQPIVGATIYSNFTPLGQPQTMTDSNGVATTYRYDQRGRVLSMTLDSDTTSYTYSPSGKLASVTLPRGNASSYLYDSYDRLVTIRDALGNSVDYTYDLMNRITKVERSGEPSLLPPRAYLPLLARGPTQAVGSSTQAQLQAPGAVVQWSRSYEYDGLNRLKRVVNLDGTFTEYGYDGAGNRTSLTTPRAYTTAYQYDALNRLRATVEPGNTTTTYGYNTHDDLISVADPGGHLTTYFYDDMGRIYREVSPDRGTTTYTYDAAGNRLSKIDARGATMRYEYDALNRLTRIDFPSDADIVYTYDTCPNGKERLCQFVDQAGSTSFSYTAKGELLQESRAIASVTYVTSYSYDPNGNLTSITYPSGRTVSYTFDQADRVMSVSTTRAGGSPQSLASNIAYKPFGGISSLVYGNSLHRFVSYDTQYRITAIQTGGIQNLAYAYDRDGNITAINNLAVASRNKTFSYDPLNRLQTATGPWGSLAWTYDGVGNRLSQIDGAGTSTYTYQPGTNRLASVSGASPRTFGYDASGNTTAENTRSYVYNQNGRLIRAAEGATTLAAYTYDANGQRATKTAGGLTTVFHFDQQGQLTAETLANGSLVAEYINLNGQPLAKVQGATLSYIHTDHLGTPLAMTNAGGAKVWEIEARPFGDAATISGPGALNLRFPGQYFDQETGLHQNQFRDYDPQTGRYAQPDPIGLKGGLNFYARHYDIQIGFAGNDTNLYLYVKNNPIRFVDPLGLQIHNNEFSECYRRECLLYGPPHWVGRYPDIEACTDALYNSWSFKGKGSVLTGGLLGAVGGSGVGTAGGLYYELVARWSAIFSCLERECLQYKPLPTYCCSR